MAFANPLHQFVHHDLFGAESVAAVDEGDVAGDVGEIECFFHGGIAATHHRDFLAFVEEAVTGGAAGDALAHVRLLGGQAEIFRRGAGGDDEGIAGIGAGIADQRERPFREFGGMDVVEDDLRVETLRMPLKTLHEIRAQHAVHVARPVVHLGGGHELAALVETGDGHGLEVGARGVYGQGIAGGAGAQNEQGAMLGRHGESSRVNFKKTPDCNSSHKANGADFPRGGRRLAWRASAFTRNREADTGGPCPGGRGRGRLASMGVGEKHLIEIYVNDNQPSCPLARYSNSVCFEERTWRPGDTNET
jgi:hypothetical protein